MTKKEMLETVGWSLKPLDALFRIENYEFNFENPMTYIRIVGDNRFNIRDLIDSILDEEYNIVYKALERLELFEQYWKLLGDPKASLKDDFLEKLHEIRSKIDGDEI